MTKEFNCCMCGRPAGYIIRTKSKKGKIKEEYLCNRCAYIDEQIRKQKQIK